MLDPEAFMKNSPFQVNHNISYNLSNTTPELLKFQLHEQSRAQLDSPRTPESSFADSSFNNHLQNILHESSMSFDDDTDATDANDEFSQNDQESGLSTPSSDISDPWKTVAGSKDQNYSNMRVLIENSVFDTSQISPKSILSLSKVKSLKNMIAEKKELKEYLEEKCLLSSQFCSTLFSSPQSSSSELDARLLLKILKQVNGLQSQLMQVSQELGELELKLKNHNLVCLVSGYIEDVRISNMSRGRVFDSSPSTSRTTEDADSSRAFEALFSHIASLAAQKNVILPQYPSSSSVSDTLQEKISWASECINALSNTPSQPSSAATEDYNSTGVEEDSVVKDHSFLSASPYSTYNKSASSEKVLSEYKLALNDLKFSQEYFAKEYEYLKENSLKTISEYRKKNTYLEKELSRLSGSSPAPLQNPSRESLKSKDQEIFKLRRELNELKIEYMGTKGSKTTKAVSPSLLSSLEGDKKDNYIQSVASSSTQVNSTSTAILRKEFKKIVEDIQDQYEIELEQEKAKRRDLEARLSQTSSK
ncbi:hypothetical protein JCM33374_g88 [Metschnikowia sp. JCM 33374]|nr:hypothetical protein JCM33374_g88 [Metschnikowia sp. JCM 33374]